MKSLQYLSLNNCSLKDVEFGLSQQNLPKERATARKGISSMGVDLRTGPWCPDFGLFQTTRGTPDLLITLPPHSVMRAFSTTLSGL